MGRAHSKRRKDNERRKLWLQQREQRQKLLEEALWEPLERETVLNSTVVFTPLERDVHEQGEILWDRFDRGSLQLADGKPSEPPLSERILAAWNKWL